ncbi:MAG: hypothetical protein HY402_04310 [Elusimicrobia bacterium]|nr:hypothetical protein [Elusimicrobiota bacterium]
MPIKKGKPAATKEDVTSAVGSATKALRTEIHRAVDSAKSELRTEIRSVDQKTDRIAKELVNTQCEMRQMKQDLSNLITEGNSRIFKLLEDCASDIRKIDHRQVITTGGKS